MTGDSLDLQSQSLIAEQIRRRRRRSVALAIVLGLLVVLVYVVTLEKLGPGLFSRPI